MSKEIIHLGDEIDQHLFDRIVLGLRKHGSVKLGKIGIFRLHEMKERKSVDVNSGKEIIVPAQRTIKFKPSTTIKRLIQKGQK